MLAQGAVAPEGELRVRNRAPRAVGAEDPGRPGVFDDKQANLELKRAARSAEIYLGVVAGDKGPNGTTSMVVTRD
jgi:hypothetical protein